MGTGAKARASRFGIGKANSRLALLQPLKWQPGLARVINGVDALLPARFTLDVLLVVRVKQVIICEDEPGVGLLLESVFSKAGYGVRCAVDGRWVCDLCEAFPPDLVITPKLSEPSKNSIANPTTKT